MKTTITLPDIYHKQLKRLAIDHSKTMAELIVEAIKSTFFGRVDTRESKNLPGSPLSRLEGSLHTVSGSEKQVMNLKKIWNKKNP